MAFRPSSFLLAPVFAFAISSEVGCKGSIEDCRVLPGHDIQKIAGSTSECVAGVTALGLQKSTLIVKDDTKTFYHPAQATAARSVSQEELDTYQYQCGLLEEHPSDLGAKCDIAKSTLLAEIDPQDDRYDIAFCTGFGGDTVSAFGVTFGTTPELQDYPYATAHYDKVYNSVMSLGEDKIVSLCTQNGNDTSKVAEKLFGP